MSALARSHLVAGLLVLPALSPLFARSAEHDRHGEAELLTNVRQVTFEGRRAGEGYFSSDGSRMIFQSEREPQNPFFQIYVMDLGTGDTHRVSPGIGRTTCSWIHPDGRRVLFASSHHDPQARSKQEAELKRRASGKERHRRWVYDEYYDIYVGNIDGTDLKNITNTLGYDAEGSFSPDGTLIAFNSNRHAYDGKLSAPEQERRQRQPEYFCDIYVMNADGSNVRRLTHEVGDDGGPFFSPDGKRICWRHFSEDGMRAEVWTMNVDGSDKRQITRLGRMSWAPFYHPSGKYLIFTSNVEGFPPNFELFVVDVDGTGDPLRVTWADSFDGLPAFTPDGTRLAWTCNHTANKQGQIFFADWNHAEACRQLGLDLSTGGEQPITLITQGGALC